MPKPSFFRKLLAALGLGRAPSACQLPSAPAAPAVQSTTPETDLRPSLPDSCPATPDPSSGLSHSVEDLRAEGRLPALLSLGADVAVRVYALLIFLAVCGAGVLAVLYLRDTVFRPVHVPPRFLAGQGKLDVADLRADNVPGMTGTASRAPLAHYHGVDRWFQSDLHNTCTSAGCHQPLPHTPKMKVPAFANFHATFLDCRMCHQDAPSQPGQSASVQWISTANGRPQDSPPILQLLSYLDAQRDRIDSEPDAAHEKITGLLSQTLASIGADPILADLLMLLQTSTPGGPAWKRAVEGLIVELPLHARGEYAAKLAPRGVRPDAGGATRAATCLAASPSSGQRQRLQAEIHAPLRKSALACIACHGQQPPFLDFQSLGYSAQRSKALSDVAIADMMQRIREGKPFYFSKILEQK